MLAMTLKIKKKKKNYEKKNIFDMDSILPLRY